MTTKSEQRRRYCFRLHVDPANLEEYRARHAAVWPEMLTALAESGWSNYSLHLGDDGLLIGYVETADLDSAIAAMAVTEVNARWQASMAPLFASTGHADEALVVLTEVFNLEEQLARHSARDVAPEGVEHRDL